MKIIGKKLIILLIVSLLFANKEVVLAEEDPHFFLSPSSGNFSQKFEVEIRINTGGKSVGGADVILEFPKNLLKIEEVTKGNSFTDVISIIKNEEGKLRINAFFPFTQAGNSYNGSDGLVATVSFIPIENGNASVELVCVPNDTTDSNIVEKINIKDIIVCSANVNGSYALTGIQTHATSTPTPTRSPTPTRLSQLADTSSDNTSISSLNTPTPTPTMPVTGLTTPTLGILGISLLAILTGLVVAF